VAEGGDSDAERAGEPQGIPLRATETVRALAVGLSLPESDS
jgi:hypothetical protein